jgi:protein SCO1/2
MPDWVAALPAVNASLNGLATVLLVWGYAAIRRGQRKTHERLMLTAFATSIVFLVCYLAYHAGLHYYTGESGRKFTGTGLIRPVYFTILISHVLLAAAVPVLACLTIYRGLTAQWERHRKIAKVTFPIWLYVSVTGVVIYGMLYHWPVR